MEMNKNIHVYYDNRVIAFIQSSSEAGKGNCMVLQKKPEWHEVISFLNNKEEKLIYASAQPEMIFRHFMTFFVPVEAAGGLAMSSSGQWLFIFRNGRWDLPKGIIEEKENREQAAIREVQEECGIADIKIIQDLPLSYHIYPDKGSDWILKKTHWYLMKVLDNSTLTPQAAEGITKVEWRDPENIDDILKNTYGNIRDMLNFCKIQDFHK